MGKIWTKEEDALLRENYTDNRTIDLLKLFPGRSKISIGSRAFKLGIKKSQTFFDGPLSGRINDDNDIGKNFRFVKNGINVNKGSLLEQELDILNDIAAKDDSDTATIRPPVEDEIGRVVSPEPLANDDFTDIDNTDFSDTDFEFTDDVFSAVSEDYMADNINDFINGLPTSLQADTRKMLDDGSLTMYCE